LGQTQAGRALWSSELIPARSDGNAIVYAVGHEEVLGDAVVKKRQAVHEAIGERV
jgi:hypothetical protein